MKGMIREGVIIGGMICLYLVCAASLKQSIPEPQTYEEARELFLKFQIKQNVTEEEALRQFDLMRRKLSAAYKEKRDRYDSITVDQRGNKETEKSCGVTYSEQLDICLRGLVPDKGSKTGIRKER